MVHLLPIKNHSFRVQFKKYNYQDTYCRIVPIITYVYFIIFILLFLLLLHDILNNFNNFFLLYIYRVNMHAFVCKIYVAIIKYHIFSPLNYYCNNLNINVWKNRERHIRLIAL